MTDTLHRVVPAPPTTPHDPPGFVVEGGMALRPDLRGTRTHDHLRAAFAHDAQAARLFSEFSRLAALEGYPSIARALAEIAETETVLVGGHLDFLRRVGDPLGDSSVEGTAAAVRALRAALEQDRQENLPDRIQAAHAEGFFDIASWFETMEATRVLHRERLDALLQTLEEP